MKRFMDGVSLMVIDSIEYVQGHVRFIRRNILEKAALTEEEVEKRLAGKPWGGVVASRRDTGQSVGMVVWYESEKDLYLWLGAVAPEYRGRGVCADMLRHIEEYTFYDRWFVKVDRDNIPAVRALTNVGFRRKLKRGRPGQVVLMERMKIWNG